MNKHLKALGKQLIADLLGHAQLVAPRETHWSERLIDSHTLATSSFNRNWLIKGVLVEGQPGVIGGGKKMLKSNISFAMAISLASGEKFLGKFEVPKKMRVAILSGESGDATIQETAKRICQEMNLDLSKLDIIWGFDLPQVSKQEELQVLGKVIREKAIKVIIIDPLYLCLLSGNSDVSASNVYQMGPLFKELSKVCLDAGATPLLVHHSRMQGKKTNLKPDLSDLAFAGIQEFARQWVLIGRRVVYVPGSGLHELWLVIGGSSGQSGEWALTIREGQVDEEFKGRIWKVHFPSAEALANKRSEQKEKKVSNKVKRDLKKVVEVLRRFSTGETLSMISKEAKLNSTMGGEMLKKLVRRHKVEYCKLEKNGRTYDGYRLVAENHDE